MDYSRMSKEFIAEFQELMKTRLHHEPNVFLKLGMDLMEAHNLVKVATDVPPQFFLTHKDNRNGLMINPLMVHEKGADILSIGADRKQLSTAIAVEMAPFGPSRASHLAANKKLVYNSNKLLAPVSGQELYLSLGCSHTVAFCKVAPLGEATPAASLQNAHGLLDLSKLMKQSEFKLMIEKGWSWTIIPWDVDELFPEFSKAVQKALNGSNSISAEIGELDTMVQLAELAQDLKGTPGWEIKAVSHVCLSKQSCSAYARVLLDFVKEYGGGPGAPFISFLDSIGKSFSSKLTLGEQFWKALAYTKFNNDASRYPLLRIAMAVVNMSSKTTELSRTDVAYIAGAKQRDVATKCESILEEAIQIQDLLLQHTGAEVHPCSIPAEISKESLLAPLGQLFVRVGILACGKERGVNKMAGKKVTEDATNAVKAKYLDALSKIAKQDVTFAPWGVLAEPAAEEEADSSAGGGNPCGTASTKDLSSPTWLAAQKGYEKGTYISERVPGGKTWLIAGIVEESGQVMLTKVQHYVADSVEEHGQIHFTELFTAKWGVMRMQVPVKMSVPCPLVSASIQRDAKAAEIWIQIQKVAADHAADNGYEQTLEFWRRPDMIRSGSKGIPKGKLVLFPLTGLQGVQTAGHSSSFSLGKHEIEGSEDNEFFAHMPSKPLPVKPDGTLYHNSLSHPPNWVPPECSLFPFWWVNTTQTADKANMVKGVFKNINVLKNSHAIKPYSELLMFKPAPPAASSGVAPIAKGQKRTAEEAGVALNAD